jgi:hypothetical protein
MSPERRPVFLERRSYRRRRIADAARLLPLGGGLLLCVPLLWRGGPADGTVTAIIYVFGLWALLIALAAFLSRHLPGSEEGGATGKDPGERE